jgi:hypothetical protein
LECKGNGQPGGEVDWQGRKEGRKGTEWTPDPGNKKPLGGT